MTGLDHARRNVSLHLTGPNRRLTRAVGLPDGRVMRTPYWNPRTETLPREQLDALQLRKLRDLVAWTLENAPWQAARLREAGVERRGHRIARRHPPHPVHDTRRLDGRARAPIRRSARSWRSRPRRRCATTRPPARAAAGRSRSSTARRTGSGSRRCGATPSGASASAPPTASSSPSATGPSSGSGARTTPREKLGCLVLPGGNMTTEARVRQIIADRTRPSSAPRRPTRCAWRRRRTTLGIDLADGPRPAR